MAKVRIRKTTTKTLSVGNDGVVFASLTKKSSSGSTTVTKRIKDKQLARTIEAAKGKMEEEEKLFNFITKKNMIMDLTMPEKPEKVIKFIDLT